MNTFGLRSVLVGLCATALTFVAHATGFTWKSDVTSGDWTSPANWLQDGGEATRYPGGDATVTDDEVVFPRGTFVVDGHNASVKLKQMKTVDYNKKAPSEFDVTIKNLAITQSSAPRFGEYGSLVLENVSQSVGGGFVQLVNNGELLFVGECGITANVNRGLYNNNADNGAMTIRDGTLSVGYAMLNSKTTGTTKLYTVDNAVFKGTGYLKIGRTSVSSATEPTLRLINGGRCEFAQLVGESPFIFDIDVPADGKSVPRIKLTAKNSASSLPYANVFKIDLSACEVGVYPIISAAQAITLPTSGFGAYTFNLTVADGFKAVAGIADDSKTIYVEVMNAGTEDNSWVTPPAVTPSEWFTDDEEKGVFTPAVPAYGEVVSTLDGEAVAQTEMQAALDALTVGSHTLAFSVERKEGSWTELATNLTVTVKRHSNAWTVEPELTPTTWWAGSAVTFETNAYAAAYGTVTCSHTFEQLAALPAGRYDVTFTVEATEAIEGLVKVIPVIVRGEDKQAAIYTWKSDVLEGNWCDPNNWTTDVGTLGYPSNELVFAVIPTEKKRRAIDLQGCMIPLSKGSTPDGKTGLTISGAGATVRNGGVSLSRLWGGENNVTVYEDMTIDLNSSVKTSYFSLQKLATFTLRGDVSVMNGQLLAQAYNDDLTICDGETYVDGHFMFGNNDTKSGYRSTKGTLAITNATLKVNYDCTFGTSGRTDHVPPVLQLFDGNIVCMNTYKKSGEYVYGKFNMTSTARVELMLSPADKAVPRIAANYANLSNMTFVVKSAETGKYPLVSAKVSLTLPNDSLEGLTLDVSPLGKDYTGRLALGDDGKTLYAKVAKRGLTIVVQ